MEIIRNLLMSDKVLAPQMQISKLGHEDYMMFLEISLSVAVFLGTLTFGIRAYFRRRNRMKMLKEKPEQKDEASKGMLEAKKPEPKLEVKDSEIETITASSEEELAQMTLIICDASAGDATDDDDDDEETEEDEAEEETVRKIVDAIEKIAEADPLTAEKIGNAVCEPETLDDELLPVADGIKEDTDEVREKDREGGMQVRRQASLTMRKPFVVYYNPHKPVQPMDKRPAVKRSTSQGGNSASVSTATRNPRISPRTRSKERAAEIDDLPTKE